MIDLILLKFEVERRSGLKDIGIHSSTQEYYYARSVYYEIARKDPDHSLAEIGRVVNRCHAVVLNAKEKFPDYMKRSEKYRSIYKSLCNETLIPSITVNADFFREMEINSGYKKELEDNLKYMRKTVLDLQFKLENRIEKTVSKSHQTLIDLINKVPEYHIETVKMRLEPMIKMLEKPSIHNNLPKL